MVSQQSLHVTTNIMNENEVLNGIGKSIGGLLLAAVGEEYVDVSASEDFEDDSALNTTGASRSRLSATTCTIEASNDGDGGEENAIGLDTLSHMSNSFAEQSLDGSGIAANNCGNINNGGGVVGTVATFIFSKLTEEESDHFSSFDGTNTISGTDIGSSGLEDQANLTSSYASERSADDCDDVSAETEDMSNAAASAALMMAQMGCDEPLKKSHTQADNALAEIERAICEAKTRTEDVHVSGYAVRNEEASAKGDSTPEKSAWEKESLPPREDDLKYLEMRLKEAGRLLDSNTTLAEMPRPPSSSIENAENKNAAIDQSSKRSARIREKVLRLKATRKCSRYNGNYSRAALKPTTCTSKYSPAKPAAKTVTELALSDDVSPAKTADITDDASIGLESPPAKVCEEEYEESI